MDKLLYQGHGSFRISTDKNTVIYIDPYAGEGYNKEADAVLVTHEHPDHNAVKLITLKDTGRVYRSSDFLQKGEYFTKKIKEVTVLAVPAYNNNHKKEECVGFVVVIGSIKLYFAGDTSFTSYMKDVLSKENMDYAFFPTDGIYNMSASEASQCAEAVGAKHSIPVHTSPKKIFDEDVADNFQCSGKMIVKPGEEIILQQ